MIEQTLVTALGAVLNLTDVDADTSLFLAGGTSMHAEIYARVASRATGLAITFTDVFQHPTPAGLAKALAVRAAPQPRSHEPLRRVPTDWHPVSENQAARLERLRVSEESGNRLFRSDVELIVAGLDLSGVVDVGSLTAAVTEVVGNNSALRTVFDWRRDEFRQRVHPDPFELELLDATQLHPSEVFDSVWKPFRLDSGQLARFVLASFSAERHQLWIVLEHIISDGVSCDSIIQQVAAGYSRAVTGDPAPDPRPTSDIDGFEFAYLEASLCDDVQGLQAEAHWLDQIDGGPVWRRLAHPQIADPTDEHRASDVLLLRIVDRSVGRRVRERAASLDTTVHGLVVSALVRGVARVTGDRDVTVYWYTANRNLPDVESTVGSLAGITMARIKEAPSGRSDSDLKSITQTVADSMSYAFYPIDRIARRHTPEEWLLPDDRPILVLHVNAEPMDTPAGDQTSPANPIAFAGLEVAHVPYAGRRDRRGFTIDASTRFTADSFLIGLSFREGMLPATAAQTLLDAFADELIDMADDLAGGALASTHGASSE